MRLKLHYDELLSSLAFKLNLRRYNKVVYCARAKTLITGELSNVNTVGRCRLTLSKPVLNAPLVSVLEATI